MTEEPSFIPHFSPQWAKPEDLEKILVQREDLLAESVVKVRESILTGAKHHLLFVGPRGAGKTHLISLIHHRLQTGDLSERARFAWLNEDETATSFLKLLILIYRALSERYPNEFPASTIPALSGKNAAVAEEILGNALLRELGDRTLVVLIENLDSLFRHLSQGELLRWRAFVQNHPVFATVATAQTLFDGISNRDEPFFGFFDTRHLEPLTESEARLLLEKIAEHQGNTELLDYLRTPTGKARVNAIHDLAGGSPRIYLIFAEFLTPASLEDLVRPFEELVDRQLTSFYQERLRWLSPQQREIVQYLCHRVRPVPVKDIASGLFTTHSSITGQLAQLREMRYLNFRKEGREVLYELAEPLMRLALQVKETHNRKPLALIVDFLRVWHDRPQIEAQLSRLDGESRERAYYAEALAYLVAGKNLRHEILRAHLENALPEQCDDDTLNNARCLAEESNLPGDWLKAGSILNKRKEWRDAADAFTQVIEQYMPSPAERAEAFLLRGYALGQLGREGDAITDCTRAIELPGAPPEMVARALRNRGAMHGQARRIGQAIADLSRAIEVPNAPPDEVAWAFLNRGVAHDMAGNTVEAIADFTGAIDLPNTALDPVCMALIFRGAAHDQSGEIQEGLADYTRVIETTDAPPEHIARALFNRATLHDQAGQMDVAVEDYARGIDLPGVPVEQLTWALVGRGVSLTKLGRTEKGQLDFSRVIGISDAPPEPLALALVNRGLGHLGAGKKDLAIADWTQAIELPNAPREMVMQATNNRAFANFDSGQYLEALRDFGNMLAVGNPTDMPEFLAARWATYASSIVASIFSHSTAPDRWEEQIAEFIGHFSRHGRFALLGDALVKHLPEVAKSPLNHAAYDAWEESWTEACATLPKAERSHFEIPLRLLRAGIEYLKSEEEGSLLVLPREERKILRQVLGLPPEKAS